MKFLIRKMRSAITRSNRIVHSRMCYLRAIWNDALTIGNKCSFGKDILFRATDGGQIVLGTGVQISDRVQLVSRGGSIIIGDNVFIGTGVTIVSQRSIGIGDDTLIAEYVVIRDQDHNFESRPIRNAGFKSSPISIGKDVWLGSKVTVLRGVTIGDGAIVGAHSLVLNSVPEYSKVVGSPAGVISGSVR